MMNKETNISTSSAADSFYLPREIVNKSHGIAKKPCAQLLTVNPVDFSHSTLHVKSTYILPILLQQGN